MKTEDDVYRAHDLLVAIILDELPLVKDEDVRVKMQIACDVLCWMLEHEHNTAFQKNLDIFFAAAKRAGYESVKLEVPMTPEERTLFLSKKSGNA